MPTSIRVLQAQQATCRACPRLIEWCQTSAANPPAHYRGQSYWGGPVPSLGDDSARLLLVGLAPGANGANRTGRMFTGDRSGEWLFRALFRAGFCTQAGSTSRHDGLELRDCYITAACHCAPPDNKPLPVELTTCRPFLLAELEALTQLKVIVGLGKIGFDAAFGALKAGGQTSLKARPAFGHGVEVEVAPGLVLMGTYHPSQQNTFTGKLTEPMLDAVFERAAKLIQAP